MSAGASNSSVAVSPRLLVPFAAMSASYFAHIGFFNPYLSLWLKDLGYSVGVIGLLISFQAFTRLYSPYAWGWLSDRTGHRVKLLRISAGIALLIAVPLAFGIALFLTETCPVGEGLLGAYSLRLVATLVTLTSLVFK